jgi:AcrR family transcriptional regulator
MDEKPRRGRGRPKGTGKVDPDDIIDAAVGALTNGGYRGLSMRGVARTLGVSLSSVQHHYPTKDDLWRACVDHLTSEAMLRDRGHGPPDLARSITNFLEFHSSRPGLLAALLTDSDVGSTERIAYLAENFAKMLAGPTEELRDLNVMGLTRPVSANAFFALMTIGIGSIAGAGHALKAIYGFDITTDQGRIDLATDLADIISLGLLQR